MEQRCKIRNLKATQQTVHTGFFDPTIRSVLTIDSGDTVVLSTSMIMDGQLHCGMTLEELIVKRQTYIHRKMGFHTLTGPILVNGAEPRDVLKVRIKKLAPINCGVNYYFPAKMNFRGLPEDFLAGQFKTFQHDVQKMEVTFAPGIVIPLKPFLGVMGVAPKEGGKRPAALLDYFGANMDN
jgi:acetamidase/formamidase